MNKTKKVAWHKHLVKARKAHDKAHPKPSATAPARAARPTRTSQSTTRSATPRR